MADYFHIPVLLQSACTYLNIRPGEKYVDATFGGGGHSYEIIRRGGLVLSLDQDEQAIAAARRDPALILVHANFTHLAEVVRDHNWQPVSGLLFDLGVSSHQLDTPDRGFSHQSLGPLDMRMDQRTRFTAADLLNTMPESAITKILSDYGELPAASAIARLIISARPFTTTRDLSRLLHQPKLRQKTFQALRITVNDELGSLNQALPQAIDVLTAGGRLVVISFHSLEDRIVKRQFSSWVTQGRATILTPKPVTPFPQEVLDNPRSKSAKLRACQKI